MGKEKLCQKRKTDNKIPTLTLLLACNGPHNSLARFGLLHRYVVCSTHAFLSLSFHESLLFGSFFSDGPRRIHSLYVFIRTWVMRQCIKLRLDCLPVPVSLRALLTAYRTQNTDTLKSWSWRHCCVHVSFAYRNGAIEIDVAAHAPSLLSAKIARVFSLTWNGIELEKWHFESDFNDAAYRRFPR